MKDISEFNPIEVKNYLLKSNQGFPFLSMDFYIFVAGNHFFSAINVFHNISLKKK